MGENWLVENLTEERVSVSRAAIENIKSFKSKEIVRSMKSLMLQMGGHEPITKYVFDSGKLSEFCEENKVKWYFDEYENVYYFKKEDACILT